MYLEKKGEEEEEGNALFLSALNSSFCRLQYLICVIDCRVASHNVFHV